MLTAAVWYEDVSVPIETEEWLALVPSAAVGRVACTVAALPAVIPVRFRVDAGELLLLAPGGWRLREALHDAVVALEVAIENPVDHRLWSLLLVGPARDVGPCDPATAAAFGAADAMGSLVRLRPEIASARPLPTTADDQRSREPQEEDAD